MTKRTNPPPLLTNVLPVSVLLPVFALLDMFAAQNYVLGFHLSAFGSYSLKLYLQQARRVNKIPIHG